MHIKKTKEKSGLPTIRRSAFWEILRVFGRSSVQLTKSCVRVVAFTLIVAINWVGVAGVGDTFAYFSDTAHSTQNSFNAGSFSVSLVNNSFSDRIGVHTDADTTHTTGIVLDAGSIAGQYEVSSEMTGGVSDFCEAIETTAWRNGTKEYEEDLFLLSIPPADVFGTWEFGFRLPQGSAVGHNDTCDIDIVFSAWQGNIPAPATGFTDEKRLSLSFTATMVVLNEVYPNEDSALSAPLEREWVELFNNSNAPVDIEGWQISEITGGNEILHTISGSNACDPGSKVGFARPYDTTDTVILPGDTKTIEFCAQSRLGNNGDTVSLYDAASSVSAIDSVTYTKSVSKGDSIQRFPDGIGIWIDPVATPGTPNIVSFDDPILEEMHPEEAEAQKRGEFDFDGYVEEHSVHGEKMRELGHFPSAEEMARAFEKAQTQRSSVQLVVEQKQEQEAEVSQGVEQELKEESEQESVQESEKVSEEEEQKDSTESNTQQGEKKEDIGTLEIEAREEEAKPKDESGNTPQDTAIGAPKDSETKEESGVGDAGKEAEAKQDNKETPLTKEEEPAPEEPKNTTTEEGDASDTPSPIIETTQPEEITHSESTESGDEVTSANTNE